MLPPCTTKRRTTKKLKTKKQPELPENWTVWKSNNQGVKEETVTQTGIRGRDRQPGWRGYVAKWWLEEYSLTPWLSDFHTVRFSGSSGCFFVFKFVAVLVLVVRGGTVCLPTPPSWPEVLFFLF